MLQGLFDGILFIAGGIYGTSLYTFVCTQLAGPISVSAASSWQVNQPKQAMAIRAARSKVYSHDTKLLFSSDFTVICCCLQVHFIPIHIYTSIVYNSYMHVYTIYIFRVLCWLCREQFWFDFLHFCFLVLLFDYQLQLSRGYQK